MGDVVVWQETVGDSAVPSPRSPVSSPQKQLPKESAEVETCEPLDPMHVLIYTYAQVADPQSRLSGGSKQD